MSAFVRFLLNLKYKYLLGPDDRLVFRNVLAATLSPVTSQRLAYSIPMMFEELCNAESYLKNTFRDTKRLVMLVDAQPVEVVVL